MNYELNIVFRMDPEVGFVIFLFLRFFPLLIHARNPTVLGLMQVVYAMTEAPMLICEVIEEVWTTATYNTTDKVLTFNMKYNSYSINVDIFSTFLHLPADIHTLLPPMKQKLEQCLERLTMLSLKPI